VLLVSGAGTEGLDLKGTKLVQLMEPHWNNSRLDQAIHRGIRFKSHEHLPENEREVRVQRYFSAFPKTLGNRLHLTKPDKTVERYMYDMSNQKSELANQMMEALQEASDKGPLKKEPSLGGVAG
jgi:SNF2 family DNA or RNA helicase